MSETKHTPGPWTAHGSKVYGKSRMICSTDGSVEDRHKDEGNQSEVDARLIAAAPDMASALTEAHREFAGLAAYLGTCAPDVIIENLPSVIAGLERKKELIEAAIRKATGL